MRKAFLLIAPAILLAGCTVFGSGKQKSLDEFAVARNAPLIIPPDYTLTPPIAGTVSMSAQEAQTQAVEALFGGPAPRSQTETSMLERAGRDRASLGIRSTAGDPRYPRGRQGPDDSDDPSRTARRQRYCVGSDTAAVSSDEKGSMSSENLSARLVEIEAMLDRSRRRFEEGSRLVEEAHTALAEIQQLLLGSPVSLSPRGE
jgi:hypothetical protein